MGNKSLETLSPRYRAKQKSRVQKAARGERALTEVRNKNLAKARRVRKKNLLAKKKAAKK